MIDVFMTHYVRESASRLNEITVDVAREIEITTSQPHRLTVLGWAETDALWSDLEQRMQQVPSVRLIRNDRPGRPDTQPSQRNKVIEVAREVGDDPFVLIHNDVRPAIGWLERLVWDLHWSERLCGVGSSIVAPRYIPFHSGELDLPSEAWPKSLRSSDYMAEWCTSWGFPFHGGRVECPKWEPPVNSGHQLMMFIARPSTFDLIGGCDEAFTGVNYDDSDWGMRALMAGKRNLISQTALMGHVEGLSFSAAGPLAPTNNEEVFIAKWGREMFDELTTGRIWPRLHKEQEPCATNQ